MIPEEEIFGDSKFVSYIDLVFEGEAERCSFEKHEAFAKDLCRLLSQTPEIPAAVEVVIRRCYYHGEDEGPEAAADEAATEDAVARNKNEIKKEFKAEAGAEARGAGAGEAADAADRVETEGAVEVNDAADAKDVEERLSGAANWEHADRVAASNQGRQAGRQPKEPPYQKAAGQRQSNQNGNSADKR